MNAKLFKVVPQVAPVVLLSPFEVVDRGRVDRPKELHGVTEQSRVETPASTQHGRLQRPRTEEELDPLAPPIDIVTEDLR
jgi:hypothetical protein